MIPIHIGVDFDNTIVCYDALFHRVALERGLIPADLPVNKSDVRNHLRRIGKEDVWTEMQGYVYGGRMAEAAPYPGVIEFFMACRKAGVRVSIISHKTRHPFLGTQYDLHAAALNWLEIQGFFDPQRIGLPRENAFFELTKAAKIERIAQCGCTHFIDDLPEFLAEEKFPTATQRWLFDPNNLYTEEKRFERSSAWNIIGGKLLPVPVAPTDDAVIAAFRHSCIPQLRSAEITPMSGGGNNRVYRVASGSAQAILKSYFQNPADTRDRFGAEHAFYSFVWKRGIRCVPEPLGWDPEKRLGLLRFIEGHKIQQVDKVALDQAIEFVLRLNSGEKSAHRLLVASEACFSGTEHMETVHRRILRAERIDTQEPVDRAARSFVREKLEPAWREVRSSVIKHWNAGPLDKPLNHHSRCVSPSDFGFHNALLPADGHFRFFDFEYAGWDDPAKLVCDFFCQPQVPVSLEFLDYFIHALQPAFPGDATFADRARLLLPAYQIKWCCIMLNEFVRGDRARREFAQGSAALGERKTAQLQKAQHALEVALKTWKQA